MRSLIALILAVLVLGLAVLASDAPTTSARPAGADTVAIFLGSFANDSVRFEADYNEGNKRIVRVRCINSGTGNGRITLIDNDTREIAAQVVFLSGTTIYNVAGRQVTVEPDGNVKIPYQVRLDYPVP